MSTARQAATRTGRRTLVLVTAAFPPRTEVGAARWEGLVPHLVQAGWDVTVMMEAPDASTLVDESRLHRLPPEVRVVPVGKRWPRWFQWLRNPRGGAAAGAPPRVGEVRVSSDAEGGTPVRRKASLRSRLVEQAERQRELAWVRDIEHGIAQDGTSPALVISSGPPHVAHVAAHRIAARFGAPHIVDLRDPWKPGTPSVTRAEWGGRSTSVHPDEGPVLAKAALVVTNTERACAALRARRPELVDRIMALPNGADIDPIPAAAVAPKRKFLLVHTGLLYLDRDPRPLLRTIGRLAADGTITSETFGAVFMGPEVRVAGRSLQEWIDEAGLSALVELRPKGPREGAHALLREAAMAVAFQGERPTQIPAKVFEYVAFPVWMLALVGRDTASGEVLEGSSADVLDLDDEAGIERVLRQRFAQFAAGERPEPVGADGRYSRRHQAERLVQVVSTLCP